MRQTAIDLMYLACAIAMLLGCVWFGIFVFRFGAVTLYEWRTPDEPIKRRREEKQNAN